MTGILNVHVLEELKPFLNEKGVLELALRGKNKKFRAFQKIMIDELPQGEGKELASKAINLMRKNNDLAEKGLDAMKNIAKLQKISLLLNGLNLCATCVGFAIMYAKLEKLSGQINQVMMVVKQGHEVQADFEFKKVISEHANMLDCRKTQKFYTEEQMRKLVDDECNVLNMLVDVFMKDLAEDSESLVFSIYSLASMLAVSLRYFDELYYFNNKEAIGDGDVWHSSHDNWMAAFRRLNEDAFLEKIQDHGIFDLNLSTDEADVYYLSLKEQVKEMIQDIEDNQEIIKTLDNQELVAGYEEYLNNEVVDGIKTAFDEVEGVMNNEEVVNAYQGAMAQMGLSA